MKTNWTNDDRAAFNQWCTTGLGQKFLQYISELMPEMETQGDLTRLALYGVEVRAYQTYTQKIDAMRVVQGKGVEGRKPINAWEDTPKPPEGIEVEVD